MKYCNKTQMDKMSAIEYIKIGAANAHGQDKLTWQGRLDWFDAHRKDFLKDSFILEADEKYQFLKALHAYEDSMKGIPTGYAVGLDATASGVGIYACLSGCKASATAVNLGGDNVRKDMYTDMGKELDMYDIARKDLKDAIMQYFYSSTRTPKRVFGEHVQAFYDLMENMLPGAYDVTETLKGCQGYIEDSYEFKAPCNSNIVIRQQVIERQKIELKSEYPDMDTWYVTHERRVWGRKPKDKSIPANVAHAADGWVVRQVIKACNAQGFPAYHCHDKWFCSPVHMNKLRYTHKLVMAELSKMDWLSQVVRDITGLEDYSYKKISTNLHETIMKANYNIC